MAPVDDALDRLAIWLPESAEVLPMDDRNPFHALATVREALERLRRHPDAWSQEAFDQQKARAEAAEAEVERLREGLREIEHIAAEHEGVTPDAYELISDITRALLAGSEAEPAEEEA